jgi:hypothetical protein
MSTTRLPPEARERLAQLAVALYSQLPPVAKREMSAKLRKLVAESKQGAKP